MASLPLLPFFDSEIEGVINRFQCSVTLRLRPITPAITSTMDITFSNGMGSLNQKSPMTAMRNIPTPDQMAYVRLRSSFLIAKVISVKLAA